MDHDAAYKYLYTLAPVVADLLRLVVQDWAEQLDLAAPEDVSTEFLDEVHRKRVGDMAWKVRFREGELADGSKLYILLLVEFQLADKQSQVYDFKRICQELKGHRTGWRQRAKLRTLSRRAGGFLSGRYMSGTRTLAASIGWVGQRSVGV